MQHYASIVTFLEARIHFVIAQIHEITWKTYNCKHGFVAKARSFSKSFPVTIVTNLQQNEKVQEDEILERQDILHFLLRISKFPTYVIGTLIICKFCNDKLQVLQVYNLPTADLFHQVK